MGRYSVGVLIPAERAKTWKSVWECVEELLAPYSADVEVEAYVRPCDCIGQEAEHAVRAELESEFEALQPPGRRYRNEKEQETWRQFINSDATKAHRAELLAAHPRKDAPSMYDGKPCPECNMTGEYLTTENPDGRWDYWDIGGSSSGRLSPGYHPKHNPEGEGNWEECSACKGAGTGYGRCGGTGVAMSYGKSPFGLEIVPLRDVADSIKVYPPTALVTSDGEWHQVGFFDWDDEGDPDRDSWRAAIAEILDAHRGRHQVIVCVQCHG